MVDGAIPARDAVRRWLVGGALMVGMGTALGGGGGTGLLDARQVATPLAASPAAVALTDLPVIPDGAECVLEPLPYGDLATAIAGGGATPAPVAASGGEPAGPEQVEAAILTLRAQIACVNGGDLPRALALTGGGYLVQVIGPVGLPTDAQYAVLATPVPRSIDGSIVLVAVDEVVALPDGSLSALVVTAVGDVTTTSAVTLTPSTGSPIGWLITGQVQLARVDAEGTPVA
ncbi:MAG TPA: hypothetical protein VGT61_01500 [Thermomicrobiales bacterium]|jgi:hypothetical protein|nr:hypothetical protein [Thermomicrobiales bacterium]